MHCLSTAGAGPSSSSCGGGGSSGPGSAGRSARCPAQRAAGSTRRAAWGMLHTIQQQQLLPSAAAAARSGRRAPRTAASAFDDGSSTSGGSPPAAAADGSTDEVLTTLQAAFGVNVPSAAAAAAPATAAAAAVRRSNTTTTKVAAVQQQRRPGGSAGPAPRQQQQQQQQQRGPKVAPAAAFPASPRPRKGRFGDLLMALEADLLSSSPPAPAPAAAAAAAAAASSASDSSSTTSSSTSTSSSSSSSSSTSSAAGSTPAPAGRKVVRRVRTDRSSTPRRQQPPPQQQPQQSEQQQHVAELLRQQPPPPWLQQEQEEDAQQQQQQQQPRKRYVPVAKGTLLLPGGPSWSALRRHIVPAGASPGLPLLPDMLVVVEGDRDQQAVARAVNADVYVCDGTRAFKEHVRAELAMLPQLGRRVVVLTDPDERGRELRTFLDDAIGPLLHAFVPELAGTSDSDTGAHAAGNRGIEHVVPGGVQTALAAATPSWPREREVWSLQWAQEQRLANAYDAGPQGAGSGAAGRRRRLCALLGLGRCTAGQLVTALNRFFDEAVVDAALRQLDDEEQGRCNGGVV